MKNLITQLRSFVTPSRPSTLSVDGETALDLADIYSFAKSHATVTIHQTEQVKKRATAILDAMTAQVLDGCPIYGVTSAYGGQAGRVLNKAERKIRFEQSKQLSNAIIHVDVSTGPEIPSEIVRAALLIRINMLTPGYSAIRLSTIQALANILNVGITPIIGFFGTLGASGDLAHNGRVVSTLTYQPNTRVRTRDGDTKEASAALTEAGIKKIELDPKEGLALVNGDNFSTAAALMQTQETAQLMILNLGVNALMMQALKSSNRNFHPLLGFVRPHPGQQFTAQTMLRLLEDSHLIFDESKGPTRRKDGVIIQDGYSVRCLPQFMGVNWETLAQIIGTIAKNVNAVSDNPLWTTPETVMPGEEPYQWVPGGNFLAMYMSDALDKLRKVLIHIIKLNDRHLSRLVNPHQNNGLSANLSDEASISQCVFKGLQTQMGMYDVYATALVAPISTAFGIHEELNQDVTSHAMTSALLNQQVLSLAKYALATNLITSCQAIDLRQGVDSLSPLTKPLYEWVRQLVPYIKHEMPLGHYLESIADQLIDSDLIINLSEAIFHENS